MPLYRATLCADLEVTASRWSRAERYAREDGAEFVAEHTHYLREIGPARDDDEQTTSLDDVTFKSEVKRLDGVVDDDDDDNEETEDVDWSATCSFDVVFEADDIDSATAMAIGIPFRIDCMDTLYGISVRFALGEVWAENKVDEILVGRPHDDPDIDASVEKALSLAIKGATLRVEGDRYLVTIPTAPGLEPPVAPSP